MRQLTVVLVALLLTAPLMLSFAIPAFAQSGCEIAHECFEDVAKWFPPGTPENTVSLYAWNPRTNAYETIFAYGLGALCYQNGGYYYLGADGGEHWNAC